MYRYPDAVIMVFCKAPIPGQVKTRLMPPLSGEAAAQLHCELTERTLNTATADPLCPVQLWCAPDINHSYFIKVAQNYAVKRFQQEGADLGERMQNGFIDALKHYKVAVIIGCDCPSLTTNDLDQAISYLLQGNTCVIAPAEDGGYVLIGLNQALGYLFEDISWGTDKVMAQTVARLQAKNISYSVRKTQWDVDTLADLNRYETMCKPN